jgi:hypothetical protein
MPGPRIIILDSRLLCAELALRVVLLHEMVHAWLTLADNRPLAGDPHGLRFVKELRRIARSEKCLKSEVAYYARSLIVFRSRPDAPRVFVHSEITGSRSRIRLQDR